MANVEYCVLKELITLTTRIRKGKNLSTITVPSLCTQLAGQVNKGRMTPETALEKLDIKYESSLRDTEYKGPRPFMAAFLMSDFFRIREILMGLNKPYQIQEL